MPKTSESLFHTTLSQSRTVMTMEVFIVDLCQLTVT